MTNIDGNDHAYEPPDDYTRWTREQPVEPGWYWFYGFWADIPPGQEVNRAEHERWFSVALVTHPPGAAMSRCICPHRTHWSNEEWPKFFDGYFIRMAPAPEPPEPHYS